MCNIYNYKQICFYWLFRLWEIKMKWFTSWCCWDVQKSWGEIFNVLGFGILDILLNLLPCQGFFKNNESVVIIKFPHRMFEYYFNKVFIIFNCNENNLKRLPSLVKDRVGTEVTVNSYKIMLCYTTIPSTSNTLNNLLANSNYHLSYTNK